MENVYSALNKDLNRISRNYDSEKKWWFKNQINELVNIAKYLEDLNVLSYEQFTHIENRGYDIYCRFDQDVSEYE